MSVETKVERGPRCTVARCGGVFPGTWIWYICKDCNGGVPTHTDAEVERLLKDAPLELEIQKRATAPDLFGGAS